MQVRPIQVPDGLVIDDLENSIFRVSRRSFTDPSILEAERRLVFDKCWLYVGHESELPEPGSYIKRKVGGRPIIFVRDDKGEIRLFFDACTHRGNSVCRGSHGKTSRFVCFYHGWSFNTRGDLVVLPDPKGYSSTFDRSRLGLGSPPRIDSYHGLVFMSLNPDIVDLKTYLGGATHYIDCVLDMQDSDPVIAPGQQSYSIKANWKLLMENSADAYHAPFTHQRFFTEFVRDIGGDPGKWQAMAQQSAANKVLSFDYGHAVIEVPMGPLPMFADKPEVMAELRARMERKFGVEKTHSLLDFSRNLVIFPNLVMISAWRTIRTFYPVAPDLLECEAWAIIGKDDPPELREARFGNFISFLGPAGFGTPDDVEALENCQKGFAATGWTDLSKGMGREGGAVANDELQMRAIWRRWFSLLNPNFKPSIEQSSAMVAAAG